MAKVTYKRVETNDLVNEIPIVDGQLIYSKQGKTYMDYGEERVAINGTTDTEMNDSSTNPVENRVIKSYVDEKTALSITTDENGWLVIEHNDYVEYLKKGTTTLDVPASFWSWTSVSSFPVGIDTLDSSYLTSDIQANDSAISCRLYTDTEVKLVYYNAYSKPLNIQFNWCARILRVKE